MKNISTLFALSKIEETLFLLLGYTDFVSIASLAHGSGLSRSSIIYSIAQLSERGLVRKKQSGKRTLYKRSPKEHIIKKVQRALSDVDIHMKKGEEDRVLKEFDSGDDVSIQNGMQNLINIYTRFYKGYAHEKVMFTQSIEMLETLLAQSSLEWINTMNHIGVKNKGLLEIVAPERVVAVYQRLQQNADWAAGMHGRMMIMRLVPNNVLNMTHASIGVFRDEVVLSDWKSQMCVTIKNKEIAILVKSLLQNTGDLGVNYPIMEMLKG